MIKFGKLAVVALAISALMMGLSSCKKAEDAEKAIKEMEKVGEETKEKVEEAGKELEKTTKDALKK